LDVALCYGWIDGQRKGLDETYFLQKFTPRRARSLWSKVNIAKVEALIEAGRMREPGFAAIEAAQADGRWDAAYESQRNATVPPDLEAALERSEAARLAFEALGKSERYYVIWQLMTARTPETRERRLRKLIASFEEGEGRE
ncbi:MAG TPA: YdeI/OmpD-associated family protein, partial [Thermomicrobiales bacterium]|nr:YdeI/OmpD-associated family protein [Thermomicrobiales bacterium]